MNPEGLRDPAAGARFLARNQARGAAQNQTQVNQLGAADHGAYAESQVRERPFAGPFEQLMFIPAYNAAKATGAINEAQPGTSQGSLGAMAAGYEGVQRGVASNFGDFLNGFTQSPQPIARPPVYPPMSQGMPPGLFMRYLLSRNK
jgi:hypothetical protein